MKAKLVRDRCAAVIEGECEPVSTDAEYQMALLLKLHEEAQEIADDATNPEEYADLLEVLLALAYANGVNCEDILGALILKRAAKGGFDEGQIWEEVGNREPISPLLPGIIIELDVDEWLRIAMSRAW